MFNNIYKGKKVLVTGHTGFKGSWLTLWLNKLGADVCGYSLEPNTEPSMFNELGIEKYCKSYFGNILNAEELNKVFVEFQPEIVFHLAAQPIVRLSYKEPVLTYQTNVMGTLNVLEAARNCKLQNLNCTGGGGISPLEDGKKTSSVKAFVNITTDKCYENREIARGYTEDEPMGGYDMYSSSKGCVEIMSSSYRRSFLQEDGTYAMATARAGNVIGGGDWAEDRLIPDCVRNINGNKLVEIRNPIAVRPWQHVLEPLSGYLLLGEKLLTEGKKYAEGFNFGPNEDSVLKVADVAQKVVENYGKGKVVVHKRDNLHEANLLMLNVDKAKRVLGWTPTLTAKEAIKNTVEWYKYFYDKSENMYDFTMKQIGEYEEKFNHETIKKRKNR